MQSLCYHGFQEPGQGSGLTAGIHHITAGQSQSKRVVLVLPVLPLRPQRLITSHSSFVWLSQALVKPASPQPPFVQACPEDAERRRAGKHNLTPIPSFPLGPPNASSWECGMWKRCSLRETECGLAKAKNARTLLRREPVSSASHPPAGKQPVCYSS